MFQIVFLLMALLALAWAMPLDDSDPTNPYAGGNPRPGQNDEILHKLHWLHLLHHKLG